MKQQVRDILFDSTSFDKDDIFSSVRIDANIHQLSSDDLFDNSVFDVIDSEFKLDKDAISKKYRKTIRISDSLKIVVANLNEELKDKTIELKGSKLTLTIDSKYKEKVKSLIKSGRENV